MVLIGHLRDVNLICQAIIVDAGRHFLLLELEC